MEIKDFITKAEIFSNSIGKENRTFDLTYAVEDMGNCSGTCEVAQAFSVEQQMEDLILQCTQLREQHMQALAILSENAEDEAAEKSTVAERLKENTDQCRAVEAEMDGLKAAMDNLFGRRRGAMNLMDELERRKAEIREREKSSNNYIPFYGVAYATKTIEKEKTLKQKQREYMCEIEWLHNGFQEEQERYDEQMKVLMARHWELEREYQILREKYGGVIELLQSLNSMIAALGDFIDAVAKVKGKLEFGLYECENETKNAIDTSICLIAGQHEIIKDNLSNITGRADFDRIVGLIG